MGVFAIVSAVLGAIGKLIASIPKEGWLVLTGVVLGAYLLGDGCSCRRERRVLPPRQHEREVVHVVSGCEIEVRGALRSRTNRVTLVDIDCGDRPEEAQENLERLAGKTIRVEVSRGRLRADTEEKLEGRDLTGVVYNSNGTNLNVEQLRAGLARNKGVMKDFEAAEEEARKAGRGLWTSE